MQEVKAPNGYAEEAQGKVLLFAAGSIEMGATVPWQQQLVKDLADIERLLILNPRRDNWEKDWPQTKDFPQFREQVEWELEALEDSDVIAMYFDPNTKSPITLLELGLFCDERLVVFCPEGFWRKGNVDIVCERYGVACVTSWHPFVLKLREKIEQAESRRLVKIWGGSL